LIRCITANQLIFIRKPVAISKKGVLKPTL